MFVTNVLRLTKRKQKSRPQNMNISAGMTGFEEDILGVQEFTPPKKTSSHA